MSLSPQNARLLGALRDAGRSGVHSHDCRTQLRIGDPAKRAGELREAGYDVVSKLERRGNAHGVRYFLRGPAAGLGDAAGGQPPREGCQSPSAASPSRAAGPTSRLAASARPPSSPRPGGTDFAGRPVWLVPRDASRHAAPVPGAVWVVDCDRMSPLFGCVYWRSEDVTLAQEQQELVAA